MSGTKRRRDPDDEMSVHSSDEDDNSRAAEGSRAKSRSGRVIIHKTLDSDDDDPGARPTGKKGKATRNAAGSIQVDSDDVRGFTKKKSKKGNRGRPKNTPSYSVQEKCALAQLVSNTETVGLFHTHGSVKGWEMLAALHNTADYCKRKGVVRTGGALKTLVDRIRKDEHLEHKSGDVHDYSEYTEPIKHFADAILDGDDVGEVEHLGTQMSYNAYKECERLEKEAEKSKSKPSQVEVSKSHTPSTSKIAAPPAPKLTPIPDTKGFVVVDKEYVCFGQNLECATLMAKRSTTEDCTPESVTINGNHYVGFAKKELAQTAMFFYANGVQYFCLGTPDVPDEDIPTTYGLLADDSWLKINGVVYAGLRKCMLTNEAKLIVDDVKLVSTSAREGITTQDKALTQMPLPVPPEVGPKSSPTAFASVNGTPAFQANKPFHTSHARKTAVQKSVAAGLQAVGHMADTPNPPTRKPRAAHAIAPSMPPSAAHGYQQATHPMALAQLSRLMGMASMPFMLPPHAGYAMMQHPYLSPQWPPYDENLVPGVDFRGTETEIMHAFSAAPSTTSSTHDDIIAETPATAAGFM